MTRRISPVLAATAGLVMLALGGCREAGELVVDDGVGITAVRSACPAVGIPDYTGDITLFTSPETRDARAIDVTAAITDLRADCDPKAAHLQSVASFRVRASRTDARGDRDVVLPYFVTVLRGGTSVVTKRVGLVTLHFTNGQTRAEAVANGTALIDKAQATLDRGVHDRITRRRKAGESDAATDPLADPEVGEAVRRATFEVLVGFQLDEAQLAYNATR